MEQEQELTFHEKTHVYHLDGIPIPSVTTLMKPLSQHYYKGINETILNRAAQKGTAVHNAIELLINFEMEDIPSEHRGYLDAYKQWVADWDVSPLQAESRTHHKLLRYAGTVDLLCKEKGLYTLVDFKTTVKLSSMLVGVQLEAYRKALETHGIIVENVVGLQLKKDGTYQRFSSENLPPRQECWQVFHSLNNVHHFIQKYH